MRKLDKNDIEKIREAERKNITDIQVAAFMAIWQIRKNVNYFLSNSIITSKSLKQLKLNLIQQYCKTFLGVKDGIVNSFNDFGDIYTNIYKKLNAQIPKSNKLKTLPHNSYFTIPNRILSSNSILKRSKYLSERVTKIIQQGFKAELTINEIQRKLDIEYGFRNSLGKITAKSKELIKTGKFTHANGNIYQTYRIARTEVMRASAAKTYDIYENIKDNSKRMQLIATIDSRTREQSALMNGQISDQMGRFKYPDGNLYRLGSAPPQWSINDRETACIVFLSESSVTSDLEMQNIIENIKINIETDNILPNLNNNMLNQIGLEDKKVLLKKNIIDRNSNRHPDIKPENYREILGTLYKNDNYFRDVNKINYIHFVKNLGSINYIVLLDVMVSKEQFEIVHFHKINNKNLVKLINKNKK